MLPTAGLPHGAKCQIPVDRGTVGGGGGLSYQGAIEATERAFLFGWGSNYVRFC